MFKQFVSLEERPLEEFRDDIRPPQMMFGRCNVTGNWGSCVALDLGSISIECPDFENGVSLDDDGKVRFSLWKPQIFQQQLTISPEGLRHLLNWSENKESPIPSITPHLDYQWSIMYKDGSRISQFYTNPDTQEEEENRIDIVDWDNVITMEINSHYPAQKHLPTYVFFPETGKITKNDVELDLAYDRPYPADAKPFYARKVHHCYASMIVTKMYRDIQVVNSAVLQLMGWVVGSITEETPRCLIAIDNDGNWRSYDYGQN